MSSNEFGKLKIEQLGELHRVLAPVAYAYKRFGSQIQVENHILLEIDHNNCDFSEKLYEVLEYRLKQLPLLTWHDIVRALRSPAVQHQALASEIESQYIPCSSSQSQLTRDQSSTYPVMQAVDTEHSLPHHYLWDSYGHPSNFQSHRFPVPLQYPILPQPHVYDYPYNQPTQQQSQARYRKRSYSHVRMESSQSYPKHNSTWHSQAMVGAAHTPKRPHLNISLDHPDTNSKALLKQFIDYVKALYRASPVEKRTEVIKLPTPGKMFINLACIDRKTEGLRTEYDEITEAMVRDGNVDVIEGRKCPIDMNKIAANLPEEALEKVILVEGAPGVGKSTFAWEFCRRWERGEIAQQYDLVLLLRLRDDRISKAKCLKDLIYHHSEMVRDAVVSELESCLGVNVLLILEGYDELPDECRHRPSLFLELLNGQVLPLATVLITSRPWATCDVRWQFGHRIFQHIEVLGFTKEQITTYIRSALSEEEALDLEQKLEKQSTVKMCLYIPLNCAIVVTVYLECKANGVALPTTLTKYYVALSCAILLRYLRAKDIFSKPLENLDNLPAAVKNNFYDLCQLAYDGIAGAGDQVKLIFTDLPEDFDGLGFMDSVFELFVTQNNVSSHNFLHLTFQEFLAAVHISKMEPSKRLLHFKRHKEGRLRVVLKFLAGLTKLEDLQCSSDFINLLNKPSHFSFTSIDHSISYQVSWVFEAHKEELIMEAFDENSTVEFMCKNHFDSAALGYCIAHSVCKWVLSIGRMVGEDEVQNLIDEMKYAHGGVVIGLRGNENDSGAFDGLKVSLKALNMLLNELTVDLHELALLLPSHCLDVSWPDLSSLVHLTLQISSNNEWGLSSLLTDIPLTSLTICNRNSDATLSLDDFGAVINFIENTTSLKELSFVGNLLPSDGELEKIILKVQENDLLQLHNLEISDLISYSAAECLAEYISKSTTLLNLFLPYQSMTSCGALAIAKALRKVPKLDANKLTFNVYGSIGMSSFTELVSEYSDLLEISALSDDIYVSIGDDGVKELASILRHQSLIVVLDLRDNNVSDRGVEDLAHALHSNSTLRTLVLSDNGIGDEGAEYLSKALCSNTTLERLMLTNNKIGDGGAKALAKALYSNCTLKRLDLRQNPGIQESGVKFLIQALTVNTSLGNDKDKNSDGLVLDKERHEQYALNCSQYEIVKHKVNFDVGHFKQSNSLILEKYEEAVIYVGNACSYTSQTGISLNFPAAECPAPIKVSVKVVNGEYTLPPEYEGMPLVSSMFKITASDELPAPITVQMKHSAAPEKENSLVHVVAHGGPPYQFQPLHGGIFPPGKSYGAIQLKKFSIIAIIYQLLGWRMELSVRVFYHKGSTRNTTAATFVASRNIPADILAIEKEYSTGAIRVSKHAILCDYTTNEICLIIPPAKPGEWCVTPEFNPPRIKTQLILEYEEGKTPPSIQLNIKWTGEEDPEDKDIKIKLEGTLDNETFTLFCSASTSASPHIKNQQPSVLSDTPFQSVQQPHHITPSTQLISGSLSVESIALRRSNTVFTRCVDPDALVTVLYGNFLLTPDEKGRAIQRTSTPRERLEEVFQAMERRVSTNPIHFHTLLEALKMEPATAELATLMKGKPIYCG